MTTDDELENLREQVVAALRCHLEGAPDGGLERLLEAQVGEIREPQLLRLLAGIGQEGGWSVRSLYDSLADVYEQAFPDRAHIGESLDLLPEGFRCETAVDLGCGTGLSTLGLLPLAHQVVALDISAEMLRIARERLAGAAVTFLEADFTRRIPLPDRSTDLVYSVGALRHVPVGSEAAVLAECARILRPGGLALLTLVTPALGPAQVLDQALARYMSAHGITDRRFLEEEILEDCRAAGLDVMETWSEPSRYLYGKLFLLARRATGSPESRTAPRIG